MILHPNAKINIGLNIVEKRPDGYHNLQTVFYPIHLTDVLEIDINENLSTDYQFSQSDGLKIDGDDADNLVVRALRLLQKHHNIKKVDISLSKYIPFGAGLGGGSADAAFTLKALNHLFTLKISDGELKKYAAQLGADCPVFIENRPVYAEGIGDKFSEIQLSLAGYYLLLVKPNIHVSTAAAYAMVTPCLPQVSLKESIHLPISEWKECIKNDFEISVFKQFPDIELIKSKLYELGAEYASMSGSGSSVYGIFKFKPLLDTHFADCFVSVGLLQ